MTARPTGVAFVRLLHGALLAGLVMVSGLFVFLVTTTGGPLLGQGAPVGLVLAGAGAVVLAVALLVMRRRVQPREGSRTVDEYWADDAIKTSAIAFWATVDCATILGALGFLMSGDLVAAAVAAIGIGVLAFYGPGRLADD